MERLQTVCIIRKGDHILLARQKDTPQKQWKKGIGLWNGLGGNFDGEQDADIEATAHREVYEEARVRVPNLYKAGVIDFYFPNGDHHEVHFFGSDGCEGEPQQVAACGTGHRSGTRRTGRVHSKYILPVA